MRFLLAHPGPHFSVHDLYEGWREALVLAGQEVFTFNLQDRLSFYGSVLLEAGEGQFKRALSGEQATELAVNGLYASILKIRPHVLMIVSGFFVPVELLDIARAAGVKVVTVFTEEPYEHSRQVAIAPHADLNLINDPTNLNAFRAVARVEYFCQAYRPTIHHTAMPDPDLVCDFAFVGTGYPSRVAFFEAMDLDGLDVLLAGNWQLLLEDSPLRQYLGHDFEDCLDNTDTARVYQAARCGLNLYRREAESAERETGWAIGPREVEMAACESFFLRDPRGEGDEVLDMLPTFASPEDASEQLRWWLAHPDQRHAAARKARDAIADRTFSAHAARLLRLLDSKE